MVTAVAAVMDAALVEYVTRKGSIQDALYESMVRDLPQGERSRKLGQHYDPRYLINAELITILLRTGIQMGNVLPSSTGC